MINKIVYKLKFEKIPWELVKNPPLWASGSPSITSLEELIEYCKSDFKKKELFVPTWTSKKSEALIYICEGGYVEDNDDNNFSPFQYFTIRINDDVTIKKRKHKHIGEQIIDIEGKNIEKIDDIIHFKNIKGGYAYFSKIMNGEYNKIDYYKNTLKRICHVLYPEANVFLKIDKLPFHKNNFNIKLYHFKELDKLYPFFINELI